MKRKSENHPNSFVDLNTAMLLGNQAEFNFFTWVFALNGVSE